MIIPSKTDFSKRASAFVSEPNALTLLLEKKRAEGAAVLDLTESNPTKCGFTSLNDLVGNGHARSLQALKDSRNLVYNPNPRGFFTARESICAYYASHGATVHPDQVFLTCGTSEAYSLLFHLLCDAGESVLCAPPVYPLIDHLAAYAGIEIERFSDIGSLQAFAGNGRDRSLRALTLVNPANPTGRYVSKKDWDIVDGFCKDRGMAVVSDEVFFDFNWDPERRISGASRADGLHFTLNGVSKMLGLPQMKLAWITVTGPKKEVEAAAARLELLSDSFLSVNTPAQNALPFWLADRRAFIGEVMERVKGNFEILSSALKTRSVRPEGGWYAIVPLPSGMSDEDAALRLIKENDLLVHPGYFFELSSECLVVSLLPEAGIFEEGAKRLARGIITNHGHQRNPRVE